jgi:tetraacyldisaccharide 4'-kinase
LISAIFAASARARRRWYDRRPYARRRLAQPVVSIGNLSVGGSGKTPTVAHLARRLVSWGERPSILTRGYGRLRPRDGVVVVREPDRIVGRLDESGDEPLMLARAAEGVAVLVSPDRYAAGCLAERAFGCTVHLLDDGFQHLALVRDVDLLIVTDADFSDRTLPSGRLREPLDVAAAADAVLASDCEPARVAALGAKRVYRLSRTTGSASAADGGPVFIVTGIARPERVMVSAQEAGWTVAGTRYFNDHHQYSRAEVDALVERARATGAQALLTTAKDAVRFAPHEPLALPLLVLPLEVTIEPEIEFEDWLRARVTAARRRGANDVMAPESHS